MVTTPNRVATVYNLFQKNLWVYAGVRVNSGKTQVWNAAGIKPPVCEAMDRIAQAQHPEAKVWRGSEVPADRQGVKVLGAPIGHPAFVAAQLSQIAEHQAILLQRIALMPDLQSAWLLLLHCVSPPVLSEWSTPRQLSNMPVCMMRGCGLACASC